MRSQLFAWVLVIGTLTFATIDPSTANAQHYLLNPAPAVRVAPNVMIFPQYAPVVSYYPYQAMFYSSYGYSYPAYPVYYAPVAYPTPVYVPGYHAAFYSNYYYPVGYGYYYYRGW